MYYVYILKSIKDSASYVGLTDDMKGRLEEHNGGKSRYTKGHLPWKLVWCGIFINKDRAVKFEKYLKSGSGIAFMRRHLL